MVETIPWCQVHDGNPDDCERKIAWDESCDVVELIDPASIDYEAAARLLEQKQTVARGRFRLDEADAADIVDAALGVGEPVEVLMVVKRELIDAADPSDILAAVRTLPGVTTAETVMDHKRFRSWYIPMDEPGRYLIVPLSEEE